METYKLRFFFDNFAGVCLWAGDIATMERFDYPVDLACCRFPATFQRLVIPSSHAGSGMFTKNGHGRPATPWPCLQKTAGHSLVGLNRHCRMATRLPTSLLQGS